MGLHIFSMLFSMGPRYVVFRVWYEFLRKTGLLACRFPRVYRGASVPSIQQWINEAPPFFINMDRHPGDIVIDHETLKMDRENIIKQNFKFFNGKRFFIHNLAAWNTNPENGYQYDSATHWTRIADIDPSAGDIKYVWERSRFCWLFDLIRCDYHTGTDSSAFVFGQICSWIDNNPVNRGPHWRCGQEVGLRLLNWVFALYFYRSRNTFPGEEEFKKIAVSIYSQTRRVEDNFKFSCIAVRNNHAIAEALCLYAVGTLFPWFDLSVCWARKGKKALIKEGLHQIYEDGAYIQHSFNYQRVAVQLFTFALALANRNNDAFPEALRERLFAMVDFLYQMQDDASGMLPNYGANDGSLFFPLSSCVFRDFRPQINTLHVLLRGTTCFGPGAWNEDAYWFCGTEKPLSHQTILEKNPVRSFSEGGYYTLRMDDTMIMVRCPAFRHRPSQADVFHSDLWFRGINIFPDPGSFSYIPHDPVARILEGSSAHNTVTLLDEDQMKKGPRFIWYRWPRMRNAALHMTPIGVAFEGTMSVYRHKGGIIHTRRITLSDNGLHILVEDRLHPRALPYVQRWNIDSEADKYIDKMTSFSATGAIDIRVNTVHDRWFSYTYGRKEALDQIQYPFRDGVCKTEIVLKRQ
jgi:hypothetical protein